MHSFSYPDFVDLAKSGRGVAELSAYTILPASVRTGDEPKLEAGLLVSANYFSLLGARTQLGRVFTADEDRVGGPPVVILSDGLWRSRFGGDPQLLGKSVIVNGQPLTVVGVTEPGFRGHIAAVDFALWVPVTQMQLVSNRGDEPLSRRSSSLEIVGRLAPGVTRSQARQALNTAAIQIGHENGVTWDRGVDTRRYLPIPSAIALPAGGFLGMLVLLGGLVMLIASANVANMLLARSTARGKEIGVRLALGASRGRLIRQLVTESLLLFLVGGSMGTVISYFAVGGLSRMQPPVPLPVAFDFHLDLRVLLVALLVTLAAGLFFGLLPALQATRTDLAAIIRDALAASTRLGRWKLRGGMVAAQVAGTAFLLVIAGLFIRALGRAGDVKVGFNPGDVQVLGMEMRVSSYQGSKLITFAGEVQRQLAEVPGVVSVAATDFLPLNMGNQQTIVTLEGKPAEPNVGLFETDFASVTPEYFSTLELPLKQGRSFAPADRDSAPLVAIVNEAMAQRLWPGENPVGKRLHFGSSEGPLTEIVGVAANSNVRSIGEHPVPTTYVPLAQSGGRNLTYLVRTRPGLAPPTRELRSALHRIDPDMPLSLEGRFTDIISIALLPNRIAMVVATLFGLTGITLAAVGLYGLLAYRVQCRRKEIGIRIALGAGAGDVRRLVTRDALGVTGAGLVLGLLVAGGATQLLQSLLFGLSPLDPVTYGAIGALLLLVGWLAAVGPMRRALRTEPLEVLRNE